MRTLLAAAATSSPADYTDIRFERRRGIDILHRGQELVHASDRAGALGLVRCYLAEHGWGTTTFRDAADVPAAVQRAHELALALPRRTPRPLPPVPARRAEVGLPAGRDPAAVERERKLALTGDVARRLLEVDRRVGAARVHYEDAVHETTLVSSEGLDLFECAATVSLEVMVQAEEGGSVEHALDSIATPGDWPDVAAWAEGVGAVPHRAVSLLHASPVRSGRYPLVLDPRMAGILAHCAAGHLCQADSDEAPPAPLPVGTRVGPDLLTVGDDGTSDGLRGTRAFDHEGIAPGKVTLIQHGVVVGHVHTRTTAAAAGTGPTGSARGRPGEPPRARLSNTFFVNGRGDLEALLRGVQLGVYLAEPVGAAHDAGRAGFRAGLARMIRGGELAEPVKGASLQAEPLALLGLVELVGGDFQWDTAAAACRSGSAGPVPVGTGAPHVRLLEAALGEAG